MTAQPASPEAVNRFPMSLPPLDERAPLIAPVTARAMRRAGAVLGAVWGLGALLAIFGNDMTAEVGAGLTLPGGGHFAAGHLVHGAITLVAFVVSVLIWWMIGAYAAPFVVWGLDLVATVLTGHHASADGLALVAAVLPCLVLASFAIHAIRHRRRLGRAAALNRDLARVPVQVSTVPSRTELPVGEATPADLERLRFALDLALQPEDAFDGFDRRDQFREAALRYQLCILGYALSVYRYDYTPAFAGWLTEAHARSIRKMSDRRVWGYWSLENKWGRFSTDRDPVDNADNVMLTGWQGVAVGMFESLADARFSEPGALPYRWSADEQYDYDFPALARSIERNMERSPFTLFSCEPRWIYPVCNTFAVNTLLLHRRLHDGTAFDRLESQIRGAYLQEFHRPDGRVIGVRSETFGMSWSPWSGDGVWLPTTYWLHAAMPDLAHRSWWLMREKVLQHRDGVFALPPTLANRCDSGSYRFGGQAFGQILLAMAAREIGDEEVAGNVLAQLDETQPLDRAHGAARFSGVSTQGNLYALMARFGRDSAVRDLVGHGLPDAWRTGPRLLDAAYPDVLVARAVTDGAALDCVLYPGAGPRRVSVVVDRLRPGARYRVRGASERDGVAGPDGRLSLDIDLHGRTEVTVEPAL